MSESATELQPTTNEPTNEPVPEATQEEVKPAETADPAVEEAKPSSNEPVEGSGADGASLSLFTNVTPTIFTVIAFIAFLCFLIGTPLPWLRTDLTQRVQVSLWDTETFTTGAGSVTVKVSDYTCDEQKEYFKGAEAFSIITIFISAVTVVIGAITKARGTSAKPLGTIFSFVTFATSLIAWGIAVAAYRKNFCGAPSYDDGKYYVYTGAGLFVAGWVLTAVNFIVSLKDIEVPKVLPEALLNKVLSILFTLTAAFAFLFALISTPISLYSKWTSLTKETRISAWHVYQYDNDVMVSKSPLRNINCGDWARYGGASQAFHILAIVSCLAALVVGVLAVRGTTGLKAIIVSGLFATVTGVVATGSDLVIFYRTFCKSNLSLEAQGFHRDAGLALIATSFVIMGAVTLVAIGTAVSQLISNKPEGGNVSKGSFIYIIGTIVSLVFLVVGLATPAYTLDQGDRKYTQVMWWEVRSVNNNQYRQRSFTCEAVWQRMVGGGSIIIAAIAISFFAAVAGIAQFTNGGLNKAATGLGFLSALLQLIGFSLAADAWRSYFCGFSPRQEGYEFDIGFALVPAAFCITVVASVLNLVLKA